jgi:hypothetical protein
MPFHRTHTRTSAFTHSDNNTRTSGSTAELRFTSQSCSRISHDGVAVMMGDDVAEIRRTRDHAQSAAALAHGALETNEFP